MYAVLTSDRLRDLGKIYIFRVMSAVMDVAEIVCCLGNEATEAVCYVE